MLSHILIKRLLDYHFQELPIGYPFLVRRGKPIRKRGIVGAVGVCAGSGSGSLTQALFDVAGHLEDLVLSLAVGFLGGILKREKKKVKLNTYENNNSEWYKQQPRIKRTNKTTTKVTDKHKK